MAAPGVARDRAICCGRFLFGLEVLTDSTVYTRYIVAIWVMIATERYADGRIALLTRQFREAQLHSDDAEPAFAAGLALADRRSRSGLAELVIVVTAVVWSGLTARYAVALGSSWEGTAAAARWCCPGREQLPAS